MARISLRDPADVPELQPVLETGRRIMGFLPHDGLLMAHQPAVLRAFLGLVQAVYAPGRVDPGLKRLLGLVCSGSAGCTYCQNHAANAADNQGINPDKLNDVWVFETSPRYDEAERAALRLARDAGMTPTAVTDADFEQLRKFYSEAEIIEMVSVIAMYGFLNRWNLTLDTDLEPYFAGKNIPA